MTLIAVTGPGRVAEFAHPVGSNVYAICDPSGETASERTMPRTGEPTAVYPVIRPELLVVIR